MRAILAALCCGIAFSAIAADCPEGDGPFPAQYTDTNLFLPALEALSGQPDRVAPLAAVVVPHHLVVPDLIAGGIALARTQQPERILLLFPDHFNRTGRGFATTRRAFETVLGTVPNDTVATEALVNAGIPESCLFGADHGIGALLPFVAHLLPDVPIIPVALSIHSRPEAWDRLAALLAPLARPETLILQSTDFSHYLPHHEARLRDQQVLNILAADDEDALLRLTQPDHIDSLAALYLTRKLTQGRAAPIVLANRNQQELSHAPLAETTSYMVIAFADHPGPMPAQMFDETILVLAGDLFLGRNLPRMLADELAAERLAEHALLATGGSPLFVNLEGVLLEEMPPDLPHLTLGMPADVAAYWLERLNIGAVGLANNHAEDLGPTGLIATKDMLDKMGVLPVTHATALALPRLSLVALSDLSNTRAPYKDMITSQDLDSLLQLDARVPVTAFFHWGREKADLPGPRERHLAREALRRGASVIVGSHPHRASDKPEILDGGDVIVFWSLGNFLFDQTGADVSGALVELRMFPQGTVFARQLPLPNLFDAARGVALSR